MNLKKQIVELACIYSIQAYDELRGDDVTCISNKFTSTTAYIIDNPVYQVVVFKGTQENCDWLFNLSAVPFRYNKRWCHGGFTMAHRSVWSDLRKRLDPNRMTIVCGHSLGGALAELSAHCMQDFPLLHLVTFGKPNVFFRPKKSTLKLKTQTSFIHGSDVVARLPRYFYGPDPDQTLVYFDELDRTHVNPEKSFLRSDWNISNAISDHSIESYTNLVYDRYLNIMPELDERFE